MVHQSRSPPTVPSTTLRRLTKSKTVQSKSTKPARKRNDPKRRYVSEIHLPLPIRRHERASSSNLKRATPSPTDTSKPSATRRIRTPKDTIPVPTKKRPSKGTDNKPALFGTARKLPSVKKALGFIERYQRDILKIDPRIDGTNQLGKTSIVPTFDPIGNPHQPEVHAEWKSSLPTPAHLLRQQFGRPDNNHSFTQEACMETCLHLLLKSGYLDRPDLSALKQTNPLVGHLDTMRRRLESYDFRWIRNMNKEWATQTSICHTKSIAMLACLFHYNLDVSLLMRYLGNNYTASHRNVQVIVDKITPHVDEYLIQHFVRVMTVGCPNRFNYESTRENSLRYWRAGNNTSSEKISMRYCKQ